MFKTLLVYLFLAKNGCPFENMQNTKADCGLEKSIRYLKKYVFEMLPISLMKNLNQKLGKNLVFFNRVRNIEKWLSQISSVVLRRQENCVINQLTVINLQIFCARNDLPSLASPSDINATR